MDKKYTVYPGKFPCHTCKEEVKTIRFFADTTEATWMCSQKHLSRATLVRQTKYTKRGKV